MTTANPQQRQFTLFHKFNIEVRPSDLEQRNDRTRPMACPFEEIAESEEEDMQLSELTSPDGRSPFAVTFESPFAERRGSPRILSSTCARQPTVASLCLGFSNPNLRCRQAPTIFGSFSSERHDSGHFFTLPPIPETASS
ncbi:unnamed protein product [Cylicostephanus goldi]|uniref:Uncharacterized protein n=1 Tax=Cylicostephanus goldi TaxID=71465 RepID=A0A3P6QQU8_CYLGO|nr:unnamed protein product [Cylicostephanus goldi]